jgi:hypothetical protein
MTEMNGCTTIDLTLLVMPKGDKRKLTFGITKSCPDNRIEWILTFVLEEKSGETWVKRVDFKLKINTEAPTKTHRAELLFNNNNLSTNQLRYVSGPMYLKALSESRPRPVPPELLQAIFEIARVAEEASLEGDEDGLANIDQQLRAFLAAAPTPTVTLKDMAITFLDID